MQFFRLNDFSSDAFDFFPQNQDEKSASSGD